MPLEQKIIKDRPLLAVDTCFDGTTSVDASKCDAVYRTFTDTRVAAGEPTASDVMKCQLKPLNRVDYGVSFTAEQWAKLQSAFPAGVCDYSKPGVDQVTPEPWQTFAGGPGGKPLGPAPGIGAGTLMLMQNTSRRRARWNSRSGFFARAVRPLLHAAAGGLWRADLQARGEGWRHGPWLGTSVRSGWRIQFFSGPEPREASAFLINLERTTEGLDLCLRLIDRMDVLIENFRPGAMDRLGLGYAAVHKRNPRLVYCSISGYGQDGPARDEAAMDLVVQSSSGLLSITGTEQGESVRCGYGVTGCDRRDVCGHRAYCLRCGRAREALELGQFVDVSMQDSMTSTMSSKTI